MVGVCERCGETSRRSSDEYFMHNRAVDSEEESSNSRTLFNFVGKLKANEKISGSPSFSSLFFFMRMKKENSRKVGNVLKRKENESVEKFGNVFATFFQPPVIKNSDFFKLPPTSCYLTSSFLVFLT
jgi:hypothetical protein